MKYSQLHFSDQEGLMQAVRYGEIDLYQLQELFNITAFWAKERSIEDLAIAIANSEPVISVWDQQKLIGFARATSDGIYRATIWDVVIHPQYQGQGLGRKLIKTVLSHPRMQRVERVYLMTTNKQEFYQKNGFQVNHTTTMVLYNQSELDCLVSQEIQEIENLV